jgi:hypothetical protein
MSESIRLCNVHHAVRMFRRRVHSEQFHFFGASVNEVVFHSGRHREHIAGANVVRVTAQVRSSLSFDENQDLVDKLVNFATNVVTRRDTHQDHLRVFVREQDLAELIVRECRLLDILELHKYAYSSDSMTLATLERGKRHAP